MAAGPTDWRASLEVLKRRFPDRWRDTSRYEHAGVQGEPVRLEVSRERASEVLALLEEAGAVTGEQQRALEAGGG